MFMNPVNITSIPAERIYVDMKIKFVLCFDGRTDFSCYANHLEVFVYNGTLRRSYLWLRNVVNLFQFLHNITASRHENGTITEKTQNETFSFLRNISKTVTFGLKSSGACVTLYDIKMYYYYCEERIINNVKFPKTISPPHGSVVHQLQLNNSCVNNSKPWKPNQTLYFSCYSNGTFLVNNGASSFRCNCLPGYEPRNGCSRTFLLLVE